MANDTKPQQQKPPPATEAPKSEPPKSEPPGVVETAARIAQLEAELASLKGAPRGVVKGPATYRLTQPHYRQGAMHPAGTIITVTDEVPSRTWVPVDAKTPGAVTLAPLMPNKPA